MRCPECGSDDLDDLDGPDEDGLICNSCGTVFDEDQAL